MLKPRIKLSHQILHTADNNFCFGEAGPNVFTVKNPPAFFADFILLLDGTRTQSEIFTEITTKYPHLTQRELVELLSTFDTTHLLEDAALTSQILNAEELERYDRQMLYFSLMETNHQPGFMYQEKLKKSHVIILGMGSWGTWLALNLCLAGIGELTLVDGDTVSLSNLNRQVLFTPADVGISKVQAMRNHLNVINPHVRINAVYDRVTQDNLSRHITSADLLIIAWTNYGYFIENTLEEKIYQVAIQRKIAVMEIASDPLNIYIGPIYPNQLNNKTFLDLRDEIKKKWLTTNSKTDEFKSASLNNSVLNKQRKLNAWQYAPSLSAMAGIASSEILKFLAEYAPCNIIEKRFALDLNHLTSTLENIN